MSGPLVISLKDKLDFIESLLVPSFNSKHNLETSEKRDEWLAKCAKQKRWDDELAAELIEQFGTVANLAEAELERDKVVRLQKYERKQGIHCLLFDNSSHPSFFVFLFV